MIANKSTFSMMTVLWRFRRLLFATARVELQKKYAASLLGPLWLVLYPLIFLGIYLFLYLAVFRVRLPEFGDFGHVVFVFAGLVPFLGFVEAVNTGAQSLRQNMHLVRNVIMPIDLIPVRTVIVALSSQAVGLILVLLLVGLSGQASWKLLALPAIMALQFLFLVGVAWFLGASTILLPDAAQLVGLLTTLLFFISPVAFPPDMVPSALRAVLIVNPVHYMLDAYRWCLLESYPLHIQNLAMFALLAGTSFICGAWFFRRFKGAVVDYE